MAATFAPSAEHFVSDLIDTAGEVLARGLAMNARPSVIAERVAAVFATERRDHDGGTKRDDYRQARDLITDFAGSGTYPAESTPRLRAAWRVANAIGRTGGYDEHLDRVEA